MDNVKEQMDNAKEQMTDSVIDSAVDKAAAAASPFIEKLKPVAAFAEDMFVKVEPLIERAVEMWNEFYPKIEPYHPAEFLTAIIGFVLCFYGSGFMTLIAAVEAFRMCGYTRTTKALNLLYEQYQIAAANLAKDDLVDENKDGISDNKQRPQGELVKRKLKIAAKSCDPEALSDGFQGMYAGLIAVIATLQLRFAQVLTLGASLGDGLHQIVSKFAPAIQEAMDPEFAKWVPQGLMYVCKFVGVSLAWFVQRMIFGFTSAMKGGPLLCRGVRKVLVLNKVVDDSFLHEDSANFNYASFAVSALGFYAQFNRGFGNLGFAAIIFFPLSCFDTVIGWLLGSVA
jgi:hypothetical protein